MQITHSMAIITKVITYEDLKDNLQPHVYL